MRRQPVDGRGRAERCRNVQHPGNTAGNRPFLTFLSFPCYRGVAVHRLDGRTDSQIDTGGERGLAPSMVFYVGFWTV